QRIGPAQSRSRKRLRHGLEQPAEARAVQTCRRPPVAVELEHDTRVAARELPSSQCGGGFVRALHDQHVRTERAQLVCDAKRQGRVEHGAVDPSRTDRRRESKRRVVTVGTVRRPCEHAQVELGCERVPLARERRFERQPVPGPPDEQHPRLQRAISSSCRSSFPKTRSGAYSSTDSAAPVRSRSRSPASEKKRRTASPRAAVSPAGTSSPLIPSRTTSATPPASIASTGVPTAKASTTVWGKF